MSGSVLNSWLFSLFCTDQWLSSKFLYSLGFNRAMCFRANLEYFPRRFQVEASTNQVAEQRMQLYNLPWKIVCEVMNVELKVLALSCLRAVIYPSFHQLAPKLLSCELSCSVASVFNGIFICRPSRTLMRFTLSSLCFLNQRWQILHFWHCFIYWILVWTF